MAYTDFDTDVRFNPAELESGKFIKINDSDSRFPYVSTTRVQYGETGVTPTTAIDVYPHTAVLTYVVNAGDISGGGGGGGTVSTTNWNFIEFAATTSFTTFPSNAAKKISILNDSGDATTGKNVALRKTGSTATFILVPGMSLDLELVTNTNEIQLSAAGACTIHAVWSNQS